MSRRRCCTYGGDVFFCSVVCVTIAIVIIRFALFAPFGDYAAYASNHDAVIHRIFELDNSTYPKEWMVGEKIAEKWGKIGFYWNVVIWAPSIYFIPPFNLPLLVMDGLITGYMAQAAHYQTNYSPHDKGTCYNNPNFHDMARPAGANESFFEIAARLNATVSTPQDMCAGFVKEWQYAISCTFFYALITLLQLLSFLGALTQIKKSGKQWLSIMKGTAWLIVAAIKAVPIVLYFLIAGALYFIPEWLFRCLPVSAKGPIRESRRVILKTGLGAEQHVELKMSKVVAQVKKKQAVKRRFQGGEGQNAPLAEFLGIYDMLMEVTPELHFVDIINLSRVSKSVREAVLPVQDFDRRMCVFRMYSCPGAIKSCCWACNIQICDDCHKQPKYQSTALDWHMEYCEPYCGSCYTTYITKEGRTSSHRGAPNCTCAPEDEEPNLFKRIFTGASNSRMYSSGKPRSVCRRCNDMDPQKVVALRKKRTRKELMEGRQCDGTRRTHCMKQGCGKELGKGPRWWVCKQYNCQRECRSLVHRAWGSKEGSDTRGVGSDAV